MKRSPPPDPGPTLSPAAQELRQRILMHYDAIPGDPAREMLLDVGLQAYDLMQSALRLVEEHGPVLYDGEGGAKVNPACNVARDAGARLLAACRLLHVDAEVTGAGPGRPPRGF